METIFTELFTALGAEEVLHVPGLLQSRDTFIQDGSIAVSASGTEEVVVVDLTVRLALSFEEVPGAQLLRAVVAGEVLRVPSLA